MIYTVIYHDREDNSMGAHTFVSSTHDKNYAWAEFKKKHATCSQEPVAMMPGEAVVFFADCISRVD